MNFPEYLEKKYLEWQNSLGRRKTVEEFAAWLGVSRPLMTMWLNGKRRPGAENLLALIEEDRLQSEERALQQARVAKDIQKDIAKTRRSIARITSAIAESGHSKAMLVKLKSLEMEETDLQTRLHNSTQSGAQRSRSAPPLTAPQILALSKTFAAKLTAQDPSIIRQVLHTIVHRLTVDRTERYVYGTIQLHHRPRETKTPSEESPAPITASTVPPPRGGTSS